MYKAKLIMSTDMAAEFELVKAVEYELTQLPCTGPVEIQLLNLRHLTFRHGEREVRVNVTEDGSYHLGGMEPNKGLLGAVFPNHKAEVAAQFICKFVLFGNYPE